MPYQIKLSSVRNAEATYVRLDPYIVEAPAILRLSIRLMTGMFSLNTTGRGQAALLIVSRARVSSRGWSKRLFTRHLDFHIPRRWTRAARALLNVVYHVFNS